MSTQVQQESLLAQFYAAAESYMTVFNWLQSELPKLEGTPLEAEVKTLLIEGEKRRATIDSLKSAIDNTIDFASTSWGNVTDWVKDVLNMGMNGAATANPTLGLLPFLIPAAIMSGIGGSLYAINDWLGTAQETKLKVEQFNALRDEGYSPIEAANLTNRLLSEKAQRGVLDKIMIIAGLGLVGFLVFKFKK